MNLQKLYNRTPAQLALLLMIPLVVLYISTNPALAVDEGGGGDTVINWWQMGMQLFGGLALFLFGMEQMADSLKAVAGERMKSILAKLTSNRFMGAITGAFVTAVIQSSSVTTVLVVGFITAGLMSMAQSIGVIMGANIGTTITAQIVAFKVTKAALLMIGVGFFMLFASHKEKIKQYGGMLMGLGLVFFGMSVMSDAMKPLRSFQPFLDLMISMENPLIGIAVAAAFTGLIQSSSATTGIVIVMASQGFITLPAGIALAFGANIGTCVTALLASIGKPREAFRAAVVHVLFNVAGVLVWLPLITPLAEFVTSISPTAAGLGGVDKLAAETPRQIANAHTIFNIANTLIFIWFTAQIARLVEWLVPDRPLDEEGVIIRAKYLDGELLSTPTLALDRTRLEIGHMGEIVQQMVNQIMPTVVAGDREALNQLAKMDDQADILHGQIVTYLSKISSRSLTESQASEFSRLMEAVNDLENIGDIVETDLVVLGEKRLQNNVQISPATREVLSSLHKSVRQTVDFAIQAVMQNNERAAQSVINAKGEINRAVAAAEAHQAERLLVDEPNRLEAYTIEIDVIEKLKRIYYFSKRMAKVVIPEELLEKAS